MRARSLVFAALIAPLLAADGAAQNARTATLDWINANQAKFEQSAMKIWDWAEVGYQEVQSSALLQSMLREGGFDVQPAIAGIPTAFVASWGQGEPVVALLAEFDALPGITQDASPRRAPIETKGAGHACGHHLFGVGSVAAALAVREWMANNRIAGTLRLYGTPAEEGGSGKVYIARSGAFDDVDIVLHWHASDRNDASPSTSLANVSAKFRFRGLSAHAAGFPERGRSALDGVEAMNHMVNLMREHVPQDSRIHYVITRGGEAPNVVPDFAEVYYYARHPSGTMVQELFDRIVEAAQGAAMGTGTTVEHEIIGGVWSVLPNETLARAMDANLRQVGGVTYDARERAFAEEIHATLPPDAAAIGTEAEIVPFREYRSGGSTDVGDVSWRVPTAGLRTATWVPGTASHSWQAVAAGGTSIGVQGMMVAARTLALTVMDVFNTPRLVADATAEFRRRLPPGFAYRPLVGDRAPPLDYRKE